MPPRDDLDKLDERLSIIVTYKATTSAIRFSEVMDKLVADMRKQAPDGEMDKLKLFRAWWDTANKAPGQKS